MLSFHVYTIQGNRHDVNLNIWLFFHMLTEQISTTKEDYLVDTIALHDHMGILRPVFADPHICKVICL